MAKTKTPFFGLGSKGTVGGSLTSQKSGSATLLREKPIPTDPYSLPQAYQRWLYEDYAYLWTQQTANTKRQYAANGVKYHLTGFQYWMKYNLLNMPDISAIWRMDSNVSGLATDSSVHANHGTLIGASNSSLLINGALLFDGINDRMDVPLAPSLINYTQKTVLFFLRLPPFTLATRILYGHGFLGANQGDEFNIISNANQYRWLFRTSAGGIPPIWINFVPNTTHFYGYTWDGSFLQRYYDGLPLGATVAHAGTLACSTSPIYVAHRAGLYFTDCILDHFIIYRRALDQTEMLRASERRYPA